MVKYSEIWYPLLYYLVLMGWSLLPQCTATFSDILWPPNVAIRTWICRLKFAQRPIFSGLRFWNLRLETPGIKVPPGGLLLRIFTSWKNPSTSARFEPMYLGSQGEHITPRPLRPKEDTLADAKKSKMMAHRIKNS